MPLRNIIKKDVVAVINLVNVAEEEPMNVLILTDLEGISGVDSIKHMENGSELYRFACERLMADTNAAVEGAARANAEKIYVVDGHCYGDNFIDEMLDKRATKVSTADFSKIIQRGDIGAYLHVGAHAKPRTLNGFLDHVQSSQRWYDYRINGIRYGEIVQAALFAGSRGIPCVMVSGDAAACEEAKECLGKQVACAVVKQGIGREKAECIDLKLAEERICDAAYEGISRVKEMLPFILPRPLKIQVEFKNSDYCDEGHALRPDVRRVNDCTLEMIIYDVDDYRQITFQ